MDTQVYLQQQMAKHQRAVDAAASSLGRAQTLLDIVRQLNQIPTPPAYLRCLAQIRSANTRLQHELQRKAEHVIQVKIANLKALDGTEDFAGEMRALRRDLRYLYPALPVVVWTTLQELDRLQRDANTTRPRSERSTTQ